MIKPVKLGLADGTAVTPASIAATMKNMGMKEYLGLPTVTGGRVRTADNPFDSNWQADLTGILAKNISLSSLTVLVDENNEVVGWQYSEVG